MEPGLIAQFLSSPHLIDLVLALTVLEAVVVVWAGGLSRGAMARMVVPGMAIMVALRAALAGAAWPWVPAALLVALVAHLVEVRARWRRPE